MIKLNYVILNNMKEQEGISPHFHTNYELSYYFYGKGYCLYDNEEIMTADTRTDNFTEYLIKKQKLSRKFNFIDSSCLIIPPFIPHAKIHTQESSFLSLVFSADESDNIPTDIIYSPVSFTTQEMFAIIIEEIKNKKDKYMDIIQNLLNCLFIEFKRSNLQTNNVQDFITQSVRYIDNCFLSDIDFKDYTAANGYSIDYFRHKFKEYTSQSPQKYLVNKRLEYAFRQLETSNISINTLADMCGFSDYSQFSVAFKKKFGASPSNLRKNKITKLDRK